MRVMNDGDVRADGTLSVDFFFVTLADLNAPVTEPDAAVFRGLGAHEKDRLFDRSTLGAFFPRLGGSLRGFVSE